MKHNLTSIIQHEFSCIDFKSSRSSSVTERLDIIQRSQAQLLISALFSLNEKLLTLTQKNVWSSYIQSEQSNIRIYTLKLQRCFFRQSMWKNYWMKLCVVPVLMSYLYKGMEIVNNLSQKMYAPRKKWATIAKTSHEYSEWVDSKWLKIQNKR